LQNKLRVFVLTRSIAASQQDVQGKRSVDIDEFVQYGRRHGKGDQEVQESSSGDSHFQPVLLSENKQGYFDAHHEEN
jgi:hypothetical protein